MYNLTENQKSLARWMVTAAQGGHLDEELSFIWLDDDHVHIDGYNGPDMDLPFLTRGALEALGAAELILHKRRSNTTRCVLLGTIFEAVKANFNLADSTSLDSHSPEVVRILFLAANPREAADLEIDEELRLIKSRLREVKLREHFVLEPGLAVRHSDLSLLLLENQPHIVQITGHGDQSGDILLEDGQGNYEPVSARVLTHLFGTLKDEIRCVLLSVCWSAPLAEALTKHIPCAIGMNGMVHDEAALSFAAGFYQGIGFGRSVQDAFELGCNGLMQSTPDNEGLPKLYTKIGVDPLQYRLGPENPVD